MKIPSPTAPAAPRLAQPRIAKPIAKKLRLVALLLLLAPVLSAATAKPVRGASPELSGPAAGPPAPHPVSPTSLKVHLEGTVLEKGTRKPLADVNVYCFAESSPDHPLKATTDDNGRFSLEVPEGEFSWTIALSGYEKLERADRQYVSAPVPPRVRAVAVRISPQAAQLSDPPVAT